MEKVKRTERGWAGHYCCSRDCAFRRNTLLEYKNKKWVVSTVGCQICRYDLEPYQKKGDIMTIGANRWYETMAFESSYDEYDDADVFKEIEFNSEWNNYENYIKTKERDKIKNEYCIKNNIPLIRIPYYLEKIEIKDLLLETSEYLYKGDDCHNN